MLGARPKGAGHDTVTLIAPARSGIRYNAPHTVVLCCSRLCFAFASGNYYKCLKSGVGGGGGGAWGGGIGGGGHGGGGGLKSVTRTSLLG